MFKRFLAVILLLIFNCLITKEIVAAPKHHIDCMVEFLPQEWEVDIVKLHSCFGYLGKNGVSSFTIYTFPTLPSEAPQKTLWDKRVRNLIAELQSRFPKTEITVKAAKRIKSFINTTLVVAMVRPASEDAEKTALVAAESVLNPDSEEDTVEPAPISTQLHAASPVSTPVRSSAAISAHSSVVSPAQTSVASSARSSMASPARTSVASLARSSATSSARSSMAIAAESSRMPVFTTCHNYKTPKPYDVNIWIGLQFMYPFGEFALYLPGRFIGKMIGATQKITDLSPLDELYGGMTLDFTKTSATVLNDISFIETHYQTTDLLLLGGIVHHLDAEHHWGLYGDMGPAIMQRAMVNANPGQNTSNNYNLFNTFGFAANFGTSYTLPTNDTFSLYGRLNMNITIGMRKNSIFYNSEGTRLSSANVNPVFVSPGFAIGMHF